MNYCKEIYDKCFDIFEDLDIFIYEINDCSIRTKYIDGLSKLNKAIRDKGIYIGPRIRVDELFAHIWIYTKNFHFYLNDIPEIEALDTTIFEKFGRGFCLNLSILDKKLSVYVSTKDYMIGLPGRNLSWTFTVYDTDKLDLVKNDIRKAKLFSFYIDIKDSLKKLYIEPNDIYNKKNLKSCQLCKKCFHIDRFGRSSYPLIQCSIKYRDKNPGCNLYRNGYPTPIDILKCAIHALECYENRETILKIDNKKRVSYENCKVSVAHPLKNMGDKFVPLPIHEYIYVYKETPDRKPKGGHHSSPVTHVRRAYFRRSRNKGDYVLENDKFIYVGKKKGNYSFVRETVVNEDSGRVIVYQTPNE